jgi:cell division septum initiation protein DivIVA
MKNQTVKIKAQEKEIYILFKQNRQLREQIEELKKQLEVAYAAL